ncbi:MAG: aspartate kinase [Lentimicrobium sp.]|jgi:aspartate kinase|nr:aspartate kinase [Lentimicrobium sp.]
MKVFKFGGASVKDAATVKKLGEILSMFPNERICVVISAMGKTTNLLEKITEAWVNQDVAVLELLRDLEAFHRTISAELEDAGKANIKLIMNEIRQILQGAPPSYNDAGYDLVVSHGELLSTAIVSEYLNKTGIANQMLDARKMIITNESFRNARISWKETNARITAAFDEANPEHEELITITQGFIGSSFSGQPVTLGREGSDFSAAIFAHVLDASEMIIWKDVDGVFNADPHFFNDVVKLDHISYHDAIELAYFGASVIHPKTIQPLQNKSIPLYVKSFINSTSEGTLIDKSTDNQSNIPSFIVKPAQALVSISPKDFSFVAEDNLHNIFGLLSHMGIRINMMQNSAISFSICIDNHPEKLKRIITALSGEFSVKYNTGLELITIRYYNKKIVDKIVGKRPIFLEQRSRLTVQLVVEEK